MVLMASGSAMATSSGAIRTTGPARHQLLQRFVGLLSALTVLVVEASLLRLCAPSCSLDDEPSTSDGGEKRPRDVGQRVEAPRVDDPSYAASEGKEWEKDSQ
jgi:hypothetical protein